MAERKYYVICEDNCKFESMTKEQIYAAIMQAAETGEISNVDAGFISVIKEQNGGRNLMFWLGTTAEYNALNEKYENCLYIKTDDTFAADISAKMNELIEYAESTIGKVPPPAEIVVLTVGGEFVCIDEYGRNIKPTLRDLTKWVFPVQKYGTYTITGEYATIKHTETVNVDAVKQYPLEFAFYDNSFSSNDWETIITICKQNAVPDNWRVGNFKTIDFSTHVARATIIGKKHDTKTDGSKAALTLLIEVNEKGVMNISGTNAGGWAASDARTKAVNNIYNSMPEELKSGIVEVKKYSSKGEQSTEIEITNDKVFLLSEVETAGTNEYSAAGEGVQYEYFKNGNKIDDETWLRSPSIKDDNCFCYYQIGDINAHNAEMYKKRFTAFCL